MGMANDREYLEDLNPAECHDVRDDCQLLDPTVFAEDTPVFRNVKIVRRITYWDGPMSGACEVNGQQFYFDTLVESVWRYYNKQYKEALEGKKFQLVSRLWRIFAVYDLKLEEIEPMPKNGKERAVWLADKGNIIGVFWEYER